MSKGRVKKFGKLGIGPMSSEIIEAAFRFSEKKNEPLMLIASKNQIDWDGGYVNNWTTKKYAAFVKTLQKKYPNASILICRDHCGPGFKNENIEDAYKTIDTDLENGFDFIHVDFCHYKGSLEDKLKETKKAIKYIHKKRPDITIEVGTDENVGSFLQDLKRIKQEMEYFIKDVEIDFYVCETGSLTMEVNQRGSFNKKFLEKLSPIAKKYNVKLKEHNADYLNSAEIKLRHGLIDAMNVAPQFGVIQTKLTILKCFTYGIKADDFMEKSYQSQKWKKWLDKNTPQNKFLCSLIAGHYNFATSEYKKIYEAINKHENFKETIINEMMKNFSIYTNNL
ncbi:class II fructose-bisphosphate aldolase [Candidatus Peregrinibacteria bacterium]|nr:class II fructose-bisphosphate aldolase [Candidatus Peregrinibacteria bacterium]